MSNSNFSIFLFIKDITLDGGAERVVINMANEFSAMYKNVHIISLYKKNAIINYALSSSVLVHYLRPNTQYDKWQWRLNPVSRLIGRYLYSLGFTKRMYRIMDECIAKDDKAIVLLNGYEIPLYKRKDTFLIGVDHSSFPYLTERKKEGIFFYRVYSHIDRWVTRNLDIVTCLTDCQIKDWRSLGKPVWVMPNFIGSIPKQLPLYVSREKIVLSMGRMMDEQKGFDRLISAFSKIADQFPGWKLRILGKGSLRQEYVDLIKSLKAESYIEMLDYTDRPEMEYQKASIYAMASRWEGFPMVLIEAIANGLPSIAFDIDYGPSIIIKDGETGFLVKNSDEETYCSKLGILMSDCELREKMGRQAHIDAISRFSSSVIIDQWVKLFNSLMNNNEVS